MNESFITISLVTTYFLIIILIGFYFYIKGGRSIIAYTEGNRSFKGPILGLSLYSSYISNLAIIALPALTFKSDWSRFLTFIPMVLIAYFIANYFIPKYRSNHHISAYNILEKRFGKWASLYASICYSLTNLTRISLIIYLASTTLSYITKIEITHIIFVIAGISVLYTSFGGIRSVIYTDAIQSIIMLLGIGVIIYTVYYALNKDSLTILSTAYSEGKFNLGDPDLSLFKPTIITLILTGIVAQTQGFGTEQGFVQRYLIAKNTYHAKMALYIGVSLIIITLTCLFLIGTLLNQIPNTVFFPDINQYVLLEFFSQHENPWLKTIVILTILAASMSSIDTEINAISTLFYHHIYIAYCKKSNDHNQLIKTLYKINFTVGIIPICIALILNKNQNFLEIWDSVDSMFSGAILGLIILAFFYNKASSKLALIASLISALIIISLNNSSQINSTIKTLDENLYMPIAVFIFVITGTIKLIYKQITNP